MRIIAQITENNLRRRGMCYCSNNALQYQLNLIGGSSRMALHQAIRARCKGVHGQWALDNLYNRRLAYYVEEIFMRAFFWIVMLLGMVLWIAHLHRLLRAAQLRGDMYRDISARLDRRVAELAKQER